MIYAFYIIKITAEHYDLSMKLAYNLQIVRYALCMIKYPHQYYFGSRIMPSNITMTKLNDREKFLVRLMTACCRTIMKSKKDDPVDEEGLSPNTKFLSYLNILAQQPTKFTKLDPGRIKAIKMIRAHFHTDNLITKQHLTISNADILEMFTLPDTHHTQNTQCMFSVIHQALLDETTLPLERLAADSLVLHEAKVSALKEVAETKKLAAQAAEQTARTTKSNGNTTRAMTAQQEARAAKEAYEKEQLAFIKHTKEQAATAKTTPLVAKKLKAEHPTAEQAEAFDDAQIAAEIAKAIAEAENMRIAAEEQAAKEQAATDAQRLAEEKLKAERLAAEQAAAAETERLAKEHAAAEEAKRIAAARAEAKRVAAKQAAAIKATQIAAKKAAVVEAIRVAAETAKASEAKRIAEEQIAIEAKREAEEKLKAERLVAEQAAIAETERLAKERAAENAKQSAAEQTKTAAVLDRRTAALQRWKSAIPGKR